MAEVMKKLHPFRSLSWRVVWISLCLLVIPLFLHTFFLYQQEERQRLREVNSTLEVIGNLFRAYLISEIAADWRIIEATGTPGTFGIHEINTPAGAPRKFTYLNRQTQSLDVAIQAITGQSLALSIPYQNILDQLAYLEKFPYPLALELKEGNTVLAGTSPSNSLSYEFALPSTELSITLSVPSDAVRGIHERGVILRSLSLIGFIGLVGGFLVYLLTRRIARPLRNLCYSMHRVSGGAIHVRYKPDRMGFEINELGKQFNQTLDSLLQQQQIAEREKIAREKLAEELRIGHAIQESLFPTKLPSLQGLDIATGYLPAQEVGGDFYDLFLLPNGALFLAIADTAGKGISACLYSLGLRSALRSFLSQTHNLAEGISRANALFCLDTRHSSMFVTLWAAIYDPATRKLTYCNQGHPPSLLLRKKELQELTTDGIALGVQELGDLVTHEIVLEENDLLFLYTDGVVEAHDSKKHLFGEQRLQEFLKKNQQNSPSEISQNLLEKIQHFSRGNPQHDDLTLLTIRIQ